MNAEVKQELIQSSKRFYLLFQKEILDLLPENNNSELSPLLFKALHEIYFEKDITPSILCKRLSITVPNTSRCLLKLTQLCFVVKSKDRVDKRVTHIRLTQKGLDLVQSSLALMDEGVIRKFELLNAEELHNLSEAFTIMNDLFEKIGANT